MRSGECIFLATLRPIWYAWERVSRFPLGDRNSSGIRRDSVYDFRNGTIADGRGILRIPCADFVVLMYAVCPL